MYIGIQFGAFAALLLTGPWLASHPLLLVAEAAGICLGGWAVAVMGMGNFHISPTIVPGGRFVARGPYRWIRHPMYSALLIVAASLVLDRLTAVRVLLFAILAIDLVLKLSFEERLLVQAFRNYPDYRRRTKRIIPFLF